MKSAHVGIRISDMDRSLRFYVDGMGCVLHRKIDGDGMNLAFLTAGDGTLELVRKDGPMPEHTGAIHMAFSVGNMEKAMERLRSMGIDLGRSSPRPFQDGTIFFFNGPDGETIELCQGVGTAEK